MTSKNREAYGAKRPHKDGSQSGTHVISAIDDGKPNTVEKTRIVETIGKMPPVEIRPFTEKGNTFPPYVIGSIAQGESLLKSSFLNKYRTGGTNYVVVQIHAVKWSNDVIFGRNHFIGCDVALISDDKYFRRTALPGDVVIVKLLSTDTWRVSESNSDELLVGALNQKESKEGGKKNVQKLLIHKQTPRYRGPAEFIHTTLGLGECIKDLGQWPTDAQPRATIEYVLQRGFQSLQPCVLMVPAGQTAPYRIIPNRFYLFKSYSEAYPVIAVYGCDIPSTFHDQINDYLFLVAIKSSLEEGQVVVPHINNEKTPVGSVVSVLGKSGTVDSETKAIAYSMNVEDHEFAEEEEACIVKDFSVPSEDVISKMGRRDLRASEFVCSIDPITARDLDDALSIEHNHKTGGCRIGVHIADVSYFVPIGSPLDLGAKRRSTSVYFVERVIPMLPRKLSEEYCSLNAGTDKFAFSSIFELDRNGDIISEWYGQSVIRNRCRMAYEDAQRIIDGDLSGDSLVFDETELTPHTKLSREDMVKKVVKSVKELYRMASILRKKRFDNGAISLNRSKIHFKFHDVNNRLAPSGISLAKSGEANWTVEEFMLLANIRTTMKSLQYLPDSCIVRRHCPPEHSKITKFVQTARQHSYVISAGSSLQLNQSLKKYENDKNIDILRLIALYCMSEAEYICSGDEDSLLHYALACEYYSHFTSPIRRYCDIVAHRQLLLALALERVVQEKIASGMSVENAMRTTKLEDVGVDTSNYVDFNGEYVPDAFGGPPPVHKYYLHPNDVAAIAENANLRLRCAKRCSEASLNLFFILYLRGLQKKFQTLSSETGSFKVRVVITKFNATYLNLVAPDIAIECKVLHKSNEQMWVKPNVLQDDNDIFIHWGKPPSHWKSPGPPPKQQTTNKTGKVSSELVPLAEYDGEIEKVGLFSELVATLEVSKRTYGITTLSMIILPPWDRSTVALLPTTL